MTDKEQPQEPEQTIYQRDKTAPEPKVAEPPEGEAPKRPVIKPRKIFQPKKVKIQTKKPLEHRVRHIRVSSQEAANLIRQTVLDFQKELADEPTDDPDKVYQDYEKIEKFFARLAKKYSVCSTKAVGGDLEWIYPKMPEMENVLTDDLRDSILKCEKFLIPEPFKNKFGYDIILVCETQICKKIVEEQKKLDPRYEALAAQDAPRIQAPPSSMDIPS
ncbi:MAG: peptidylprolyl isomerase [Nitrospinota bacterium]|nr:peptidylprolyl isomerase [Nitrospinota bacterium]